MTAAAPRIRTYRLGDPRADGEGLRIGTVRHLPRGVRKEDYARLDHFDVWLPILAPSAGLIRDLKAGVLSEARFFAKYRAEMRATDPRQVIATLRAISERTPLAIGCFCADEAHCHRSALVEFLREG